MFSGTATCRFLALAALCFAAGGCPNGGLRRARVSDPPAAGPGLFIPNPPQPDAGAVKETKLSPPPNTADPAGIPPPSPSLQKQETLAPALALAKMRNLHRQAFQRVLTMDSYAMRLKRREVVNGKKKSEEIILVKFRKEPYSVYLKWVGTEGNQREAVFVKGRYDNKIHTKLAAGDVFLMPAGTRFSLAPDNPLVLANSRHPITEGGLAHLVDQFGTLLDALEKGDTRLGTVKYLGLLKRPEVETTVEGILQILPPGGDPLLPKGGQRLWFFDINQYLPVLIITKDDAGQEVEFYCHDQIDYPIALDDDAFNPDKVWGAKK
jgi:uncharacterized protein DUF1571